MTSSKQDVPLTLSGGHGQKCKFFVKMYNCICLATCRKLSHVDQF